MNKNFSLIVFIFAAILVLVFVILKESGDTSPCSKTLDCSKNEDCQYIWYTGGCHNPEYTGKCMDENAKRGYFPGKHHQEKELPVHVKIINV